jgi:DDE superfamily endonuclease
VGTPLRVGYEAPQGRRLNVIGGYFSHGPEAGRFEFASLASLPEGSRKPGAPPRKPLTERAAAHGLTEDEVGVIDSEVFLAFVWQLAGRPVEGADPWRRERPLVVVVDNYQVHRSERVRAELPGLRAADIHLFYLPAYSPELSRIEAIWHDVKYHRLPTRSYRELGLLKRAVERALVEKRLDLRQAHAQSAHSLC